jgi:hypothetical protein
MAKNDILAEAIADARKVKSAALANAKLALEETFTPTLQRMISSRIAEEEGDEEMPEDELDIDINMAGEDEYAPEGEEDVTGFGGSGEASLEEPAPEEDMELEALIRELDGEEEMGGDDYSMDEGDEYEDDPMMDENTNDERQWRSTNPSSGRDQFAEGEEFDDELTEALNALLEEDGLGDDLDMGPNKEDGSAFTDHSLPSNPELLERRRLRNENKKLRADNAKQKKDLNEAYRAVTLLKKTLNEINVLNAKLMYTSRIYKKFDLNEAQKNRVMDSLDRGNTKREVELVYTAICESLNKRPLKKKMTEGSASKSIKAINPTRRASSNSDVIQETFVQRMQRLANLKKFED